jgi:hypothetical protein
MARRIGNFFILLGIFLIFLFVYTDWLESAYFRYLFLGIVAMLIGMAFHTAAPKPPPPPESSRFRMFKRDKKDNPK